MVTTPESGLKICIVGAGAAGLAVIKIFKDSAEYKAGLWTIDAFEERDDVGGTWLPAPATDKDVPPLTPMYDSIITNLPHPIMCYTSLWFPPSTPLFPKAEVVEDYLRTYAKEFDLMPHIHLNNGVTSTRWTGSSWRVRTSKGDEEREYDRLVVANGHYRVPYFPDIPGLDSWRAAGLVTHSAWYRKPVAVGDKVLVIGGGFSGIDIAEEMSTVCKRLVHAAPHSIAESHGNIGVRGRVVCLSDLATDSTDSRVVYFEDGSIEWGFDHIFLATGYSLSFPFFKDLAPTPPEHPSPPDEPLPAHLHNSGHHLFPLARWLFPLTHDFPPTAAAFVGLPLRVAPFPLFEAQARALVRAFADPSALDVAAETAAIHARLAMLRADPSVRDDPDAFAIAWQSFKGREQFDYRDALHAFAGLEGEEWRCPEWCVEAYENMLELRKAWKEILEAGEGEEWVQGVGEGGNQEWVELLQKLLRRARKRTEDEGKLDVEPEAQR